ncbi:NitT/TauT family transport system ATP-binding protein [Herbaspirillum sp. Sphag1AN]|uniref:ABC transporter ATP-binding protein n=1 Tax=unclassified Herbaspirillum TaxID=2624150 RepID=UPI00161224A7|nr:MULTISPECIES: ABC transporter ATP-binding protein [unclassified Herbaspirillum]MBB3212934.1 NitT/TauT family transport system ATP-binding protein [Herbaspirillum sp. Sphag1AN]MBB3246131.1 NitT/TauT family transport system ATP-binding protein [Herbaspirillum sp. Sphag64]
MTAALPESSPIIAIDGIEKNYATQDGQVVAALGPLSLTIARGSFTTIVGPSGCGKSTLLKLMAGLIVPSAGQIRLNGQIVDGPQAAIGMVFQMPVLLPWKTALDNVLLPARVLGLEQRSARERAQELLALVGLADFSRRYPHELSGGMQQRVAIARALMQDPEVLVMDEPFGALDAMTRELMSLELLRLWQQSGKTIVFVTHAITEAVFLGTSVLVMSDRPGRIADLVAVDLPAERSLDLISSDAFGVYTKRIRSKFSLPGWR